MKKIFKKILVYSIASVLAVPTSLLSGFLVMPRAEAFTVDDRIANHVVISEIQTSGQNSEDEFIELYNPTSTTVQIEDWRLTRKTQSGNEHNLITHLEGSILPHQYLLIASRVFDQSTQKGYLGNVTPDRYYTVTGESIASDNTVILYSDQQKSVTVDKIGMGLAADSENIAAPNPAAGKSIERKSSQVNDWSLGNGRDTDDNSTDFLIQSSLNPQNSVSIARNVTTGRTSSTLSGILSTADSNDVISIVPGIYNENVELLVGSTIRSVGKVLIKSITISTTENIVSEGVNTLDVKVGSSGSLTSGISLVMADGIITLQGNSYTEDVTIDKPVMITSAAPATVRHLVVKKNPELVNVTSPHITVYATAIVDKILPNLSAAGMVSLVSGNDYSAQNLTLSDIAENITIAGSASVFKQIILAQPAVSLSGITSPFVLVTQQGSINTAKTLIADSTPSATSVLALEPGTYTENILLDINKKYFFGNADRKSVVKLMPTNPAVPAISIEAGEVEVGGLLISNVTGVGVKVTGGDNTVKNNQFLSNEVALSSIVEIDARGNYWGGTPVVTGSNRIEGSLVKYSPWATDATLAVLKFETQTDPDGLKFVLNPEAVDVYNETTIGNIHLTILAGTKISGPADWNGIFSIGQDASQSGISILAPGRYLSEMNVIEFGSSGSRLTFDHPVKIVFPGQKDKQVGFVDQNGQFKEILTICDNLVSPTNVGVAECKITDDDDMIVWTSHFTKFATYKLPSVTAPSFTAARVAKSDGNYLHIEWKGTGADKYVVRVDGQIIETVIKSVDDATITYTLDKKMIDGKSYAVLVTASMSGIESIGGSVQTVLFPARVLGQTNIAPVVKANLSPAPPKAQAADSQPEAKKSDSDGVIKGQDTKTNTEESTNWTPWIVLFVLIVLAGAATGGYFYWFAGKEEVEQKIIMAADRNKPVRTDVKRSVKANSKNVKKKIKRW